MSTELVKTEILRFLKSSEPEVLCVSGKWGVGKTFSWKTCLAQAAAQKDGIALGRYAYVSVFGINSVDELKYSIFEHTVTKDRVAQDATVDTVNDLLKAAEGLSRKSAWLANLVPGLRTYFGTAIPALFLTVRKQIICIDDLERRGKNLEIRDVLGLVSFLREQRACKVALLLNEERLGEAKCLFKDLLEKVVDVWLTYEPTPSETAEIALSNKDSVSQRIAQLSIALGISNIRVIKKIERDINAIRPLLQGFQEEIFNQASSSVALFGWARYQPGEAPTLDFLASKKTETYSSLQKAEDIPPNEAAWNALLQSYGYTSTDEFDLALMEGVKQGYFDPAKIKKHAQELEQKIISTRVSGSFEDAWRSYHDSFDDNQDQVLDGLYNAFMKSCRYISPLNFNATVSLFKRLKRAEQASEMIKYYLANSSEDRKFFDLEEYAFASEITDVDIRAAFKQKYESMEDKRDVPALLLVLKERIDSDAITALATAPIDAYIRAFKDVTGFVNACKNGGKDFCDEGARFRFPFPSIL